jgi:hypothetical protein
MRRQIILLLTIAAALALPIAALAQTLDLPPRKPGLWEIATASPPITVQLCVDPATDRDLMDFNLGHLGKCVSITTKRQDQTYVIETDCAFGPIGDKTKTVITGDFSSAYTTRTESTMNGAIGVVTMQSAAKWRSADCPGMKPGDIRTSDGLNLNINVKWMKSLFLDPSARPMAQLPPRRPGHWEVRTVHEHLGLSGLPDSALGPTSLPPSRACIDAGTDNETMEVALMPLNCKGGDMKRTDTGWVLDEKCELGDLKMATKATISGDFQSIITVRVEETTEGLLGSNALKTIQTHAARWVGATCADGMVPGDLVMSNGWKMNVAPLADLEKLLQTLPEKDRKLLLPADKPTDK